MYYQVGRCVMKKAGLYSLPTMIGVTDEISTARSLSKALEANPGHQVDFMATTQVVLVVNGQDRVFNMNDKQSVENVLNEVTNRA